MLAIFCKYLCTLKNSSLHYFVSLKKYTSATGYISMSLSSKTQKLLLTLLPPQLLSIFKYILCPLFFSKFIHCLNCYYYLCWFLMLMGFTAANLWPCLRYASTQRYALLWAFLDCRTSSGTVGLH